MRREDFPAVRAAMLEEGFHHGENFGLHMIVETVDGSDGMISLGTIDASWLDRLPPPFRARFADLLADPNG